MSDIVERAKAALEGVSDGPWMVSDDDPLAPDWDVAVEANGTYLGLCGDCAVRASFERADAEFIAAARDLVPELISEIEQLRDLVRWINLTMQEGAE